MTTYQYNLYELIKWLGFAAVVVLVTWYYKIILGGEFNYHDDLVTITQVKPLDVIGIFSSTIVDSQYYRPIIQMIMKGSEHLFSGSAFPIRVLQVTLHLFTLFLFFRLCRVLHLRSQAIWGAMLLLCFSPFTYIGIAKYGIEVGTYILGVLLMLSMLMMVRERVSLWSAILITVLALLTREQGLLIAFAFFLYFSIEKNWFKSISMVLLVGLYLYFRIITFGQIGTIGFLGSTGWFNDFLTIEELNEKFGDERHVVYLYNVIAHFTSLFIYIPIKGQFVVHDYRTVIFIITGALTALVILFSLLQKKIQTAIKSQHIALIILVLLANVLIAYSYVRYRMLFISGLSVSILLAYAIHYLLEVSEKKSFMLIPVFLLLIFWIGTAAIQNVVLERKLEQASKYYKKYPSAPPRVDQQLYDSIREQL